MVRSVMWNTEEPANGTQVGEDRRRAEPSGGGPREGAPWRRAKPKEAEVPDEDDRVDAAQAMSADAGVEITGEAPRALEGETPQTTRPVCVADWAMLYGGE